MGSLPSLLVIVGPTASGKSELALKIAKNYGGEIIAADSRTIYKGMDIGTAKPTKEEQKEVLHWGLDLVKPGQTYSAARFKKYALAKIDEIKSRGKLPILVGGTGLYIDGVVFNFNFLPRATTLKRSKLEGLTTEELQKLVKKKGYPIPGNYQNRRHLVRTIERQGKIGQKAEIPKDGVLIIGLMPEPQELQKRINRRTKEIFKRGVIEEAKHISDKYGEKALIATGGIGYHICLRVLKREINNQEALELFETAHWQFARRQRTWFRRNPHTTWYKDPEQAYRAVSQILNT